MNCGGWQCNVPRALFRRSREAEFKFKSCFLLLVAGPNETVTRMSAQDVSKHRVLLLCCAKVRCTVTKLRRGLGLEVPTAEGVEAQQKR